MSSPLDSAAKPDKVARRLRIAVRWTLSSLLFLVILLLLGMYLGARHPDAWYTQTARWVGALF